MEKIIICTECPNGCEMRAVYDGDKVLSVTGNTCPRGKLYAENECICPRRVLTTSVSLQDGRMCPVKSDNPIKKEDMLILVKKINEVHPQAPISIGDIIVKDIEKGINIIATDNIL